MGTDPPVAYSAQEMSKLREAIQEGLRQAAQQRAYAHAYSGANFEGGTSFIGMANFHMAQTSRQGANTKTFNSRQDAETAGATQALAAAAADKDHREWNFDVGQSNDAFTFGPLHRGGYEHVNDGVHKPGWYNTSVIRANPDLPEGFKRVAFGWGLPYHTDKWPQGDRYQLWSQHLHGVLGIPPVRAATGLWSRPTFLRYEYIPGSPPPE
jgi:hypothetical protein